MKAPKYKPSPGRARTASDVHRIIMSAREITGYEGKKYRWVVDGTPITSKTLSAFVGDELLDVDVQERVGRSDGWSFDRVTLDLAAATVEWRKLFFDSKHRPFKELTKVRLRFQPVDRKVERT